MKRIFTFFYLLLGCLTANFEPLLRGQQPHSPDVIHCFFFNFRTEDLQEPRNEVEPLSPVKCLAEFELGTSQLAHNVLT